MIQVSNLRIEPVLMCHSVEQGQACDYCDPNDPTGKSIHKAEYAIDGTERWWQSPPLSRGLGYGKINITIDLGQVMSCQLLYSFHPPPLK